MPYFHVVYTLPAPIAAIAYQNKAVIYDLLVQSLEQRPRSQSPLIPSISALRIGFMSVLHTWGSALTHHPHVHMVVPGGGLSSNGSRWIACRPRYFLTVEVLSALFRRLFLQMLVAAHHAGHLQFFGDHARLADKAAFRAYLKPLRKIDWVVYANEAVRRAPPSVALFVALHPPHRDLQSSAGAPPIRRASPSNTRTTGSHGPARYKTMTLANDEFIRRFLIHVLPKGFHQSDTMGCLPAATEPQTFVRSPIARHAVSPKTTRDAKAALDEPRVLPRPCPSRWPHDRHRNLRPRLRAETPAHTASRDQDRHLMMPSPAIIPV